ncbi:MAG: molybdopterin-guanine dinucleotide biosynthesis protein B [Candidatus Thermoplasmatota archaeon]
MSVCMIGFYGESKTGKTTLITRLIKRLKKEGYNIIAIKQTDKPISIDTRYKDTWRYIENGAAIAIFKSKIETDMIIKKNMRITDIINLLESISSFDCVLIEGAKDPDIPKIRIDKSIERSNTILDYQGDFEGLYRYIKSLIKKEKKKKHRISLFVNGEHVPLSDFPSEIISNLLIAVALSLKGVNHVDTLQVTLNTTKERREKLKL